jgi:hypothetical protein
VTTLVLITGTGRSGTSTMSGTFHHLGLHVPGPYLGANDSNPKGFFESRWSVKFHKRITAAAGINDFDGRPQAFGAAQTAVTDQMRRKLRGFLERESRDHEQVVVKDPRTVWAQPLWREVATEMGFDIRFVSMLRHPAEVVGSRATYYSRSTDRDQQRAYQTFNVARWVNSSLVSERGTRGTTRAFVSYVDLLTDWRPVLVGLAEDLGLTYDVDVAAGEKSAVDDFIDPDLRRHAVTWDDLDVPDRLVSIADAIWTDLQALQAGHGDDAAASADLDVQAERYARLYADSTDIAHDALETERRKVQARADAFAEKERSAAAAPPAVPATAPRNLDSRPVGEVGGRDLLRVVATRARRKLSRR